MTQITNSTYTPTLMEKLLGKNYKWWFILIYSIKSSSAYRWNSFMWLAGSVVTVLATILVWYINLQGKTTFEADFSQLFTYLIIGESFIFSTAIQFDIGENIQDGKITTKLLRPTNIFSYYLINVFGYQFFENVSKLVLYFLFALIFHQFIILPTFLNFLFFLILAIIAYFINSFIGMLIGFSAFWLTAFFGSASFFDSLKLVFSGKFFPLNTLSFFKFSFFLPFAFTFYHPMQIYLGKYSQLEILYIFLGGLAWCLALYFLAKLVFKMGLKKNESVGL